MTTHTPEIRAEAATTTPPDRTAFGRIAGVSGIVFAVAIIASQFLVGDMPSAADDVTALREYFDDNRGPHQAGLVVVSLAIVPLILFSVGLVRSQRRGERDDDGWSSAIGAFFVFAAAMHAMGVVIDAGLLLSADSGLEDGLLLALWDVNTATIALMILGFGAAAGSAAISVLTQGNLPRWYGGLGLLGGVSALLSLGMLVSDGDAAAGLGFVMFPLFMLWLIVSGILLYRDA